MRKISRLPAAKPRGFNWDSAKGPSRGQAGLHFGFEQDNTILRSASGWRRLAHFLAFCRTCTEKKLARTWVIVGAVLGCQYPKPPLCLRVLCEEG